MKVFISYSSADKKLARRVSDVLKEAGFEVWDDRQIMPGDNWAAEVGKALQQAEAMVVLFTPTSLHADHVQHEISYALGKKDYSGRVIPVLTVPERDLPKDTFPWILKTFQQVHLSDYRNEEEGIRKIAELLQDADLAAS